MNGGDEPSIPRENWKTAFISGDILDDRISSDEVREFDEFH
jgi:hypothetical protein